MDLIIVESPTKARTLKRFLGKDFDVEATVGHLMDLPKSPISIDIENNFEPDYKVIPKQKKTIKALKDNAKKAKMVYLATDPDREGEAISAHVADILRGAKLVKDTDLKRIVFHEITKGAVEDAIKHPRKVDGNLVNAQIARRVLDRLVGYKLSPLLWKKIRRGLSAGRVQSVAVRLIVEREREIEAFVPEEYWVVECQIKKTGSKEDFVVTLQKIAGKKASVADAKAAKEVETDLKDANYRILDVTKKEIRKNPYPPYTTSTLTQAAANVISWSSKKTMSIAQRLYEEGLITYHRTDSTNISKGAMEAAREFIANQYGKEYLPQNPRFYKTKSKVAQEAHEAIRPTDPASQNAEITGSMAADAKKLYRLIWSRFIASQMNPTIYDQTRIEVEAQGSKQKYLLSTAGRIMKFDGWRKVMPKKSPDEEPDLPQVARGDSLDLIKVIPTQKFTQPPPRYNEASLVKVMEKLGIGRPSTYAPIISTIQLRQYVEKSEGRFTATPVGKAVTDFLVENFPKVFDYEFTAGMENDLDEVAEGKEEWVKVIGNFWDPFATKLDKVEERAKRVKIETEGTGRKCPTCKEGELVIRTGRFGKFLSCDRFPECKHTEPYVEKLEIKCPDCGKGDVIIKKTKRGRTFYGCSTYPNCKWASWNKPGSNDEKDKDQVQAT